MKNIIIAIFILTFVLYPQNVLSEKLFSAKSLKCNFDYGYGATWEKDHFNSKRAKKYSFIIDSINYITLTARIVGNNGTELLSMKAEPKGLTFIERTLTGNYAFTTIFLNVLKTDDFFPAVTSRHMAIAFWPIPSQYYGTCEIIK